MSDQRIAEQPKPDELACSSRRGSLCCLEKRLNLPTLRTACTPLLYASSPISAGSRVNNPGLVGERLVRPHAPIKHPFAVVAGSKFWIPRFCICPAWYDVFLRQLNPSCMHITLLTGTSLPCPWSKSQSNQSSLGDALNSTIFGHHYPWSCRLPAATGSGLDPTTIRFSHLSCIALSHLTLYILGCEGLAAAPETYAADRRECKQDAILPSAGTFSHQ